MIFDKWYFKKLSAVKILLIVLNYVGHIYTTIETSWHGIPKKSLNYSRCNKRMKKDHERMQSAQICIFNFKEK